MTVLSKIDTVILHTPKTGGSSVRWPSIKKYGIRYACQHCDYKMLPDEYKNFRKITFVRNPIDWYRSRYFFDKMRFKEGKTRDVMTTALSHEYKKSFNETLPLYLNLDEAFKDEMTQKIYRSMMKFNILNQYTCWNVSYHDNINDVKSGYFEGKTYYQWILGKIGVEYADKVYRLEDQYRMGMLTEFGNDISLEKRNKTPRKEFREDYTRENRQLVLKLEDKFIKKYGYNK